MAMVQDELAPVARLYERLAEALQRTRRDPFTVPVTVAEIYQELVPYRLVRAEIGFDMNADYEHALLRLLAGEGERVRMEPSHAADEIRKELRNSNPNLSLYRDYAACDVWVRKPEAPEAPSPSAESSARRLDFTIPAPGATPAPPDATMMAPVAKAQRRSSSRSPREDAPVKPAARTETPAPAAADDPLAGFFLSPGEQTEPAAPSERAEVAPARTFALAEPPPTPERKDEDEQETSGGDAMKEAKQTAPAAAMSATAAPRPSRATAVAEPAPAAAPRVDADPAAAAAPHCAFCDSALPAQRTVRFCPYCGADQRMRPCSECGEALEPGWVFCIACGARPA